MNIDKILKNEKEELGSMVDDNDLDGYSHGMQ
jgi:hypothetical protein